MTEKANVFTANDEPSSGYGIWLCDKIRSENQSYGSLSDFEKFVLDHGFYYETKNALEAAYQRKEKVRQGALVTEEEFWAEITQDGRLNASPELYRALCALVEKKILRPAEVYSYASFRWCANAPESVIAHQIGNDQWAVNNCGTEITVPQAIEKISDEWGFQKNKVRVFGQPYYDATDWQFIRFDAPHMSWLWAKETLYQVYH